MICCLIRDLKMSTEPHAGDLHDEPPSVMLAIGIIQPSAGRSASVVDRFIGADEVIIKPLRGVLAHMPEYVGASIMGDGKTVLVVNTKRLFFLQGAAAIARNATNPFHIS